MEDFEFEFEKEDGLFSLIERYESAQRNNKQLYFDQEAYETIIDFYLDTNRNEEAMKVTDLALSQYPYSAYLWLKKAQGLFEMKKCNQAIEILDKAAMYDSSEIGITLLKAEILAFQGNYMPAIELLKQQEEQVIDSTDIIDINLLKADILEDCEKYNDVFECLITCLKIDPENEEALERINYCTEITERFEESIKLHQKLADDYPYNEFIWYNLASAYRGAKQFAEAIESYEFVLAINEQLDYVYQDMAELYHHNKEYDNAINILKDFETLFSPDEDVYFIRGECYEAKGDLKMARYNYKKACHVYPAFAGAYHKLGETYKLEDMWEQALKSFSKAAELDEREYDYWLSTAEAAMVLGKSEQAIDACESCIDLVVNRFEAYIILSKVFLMCNDLEVAIEIIDKGKEICKSTIEFKFAECAILFYENKPKEAFLRLENLLQENADKHLFMYYMLPELENITEIKLLIAKYLSPL